MPDLHLIETLAEIRVRICKPSGPPLNEQNTKATLIEPLLRVLGWDTENVEVVQREYKSHRRDKPVDYALLALRTPQLFLEAKALGQNLMDRRWANQVMGYAAVAGVNWIVLTDGNEYRIYNAHASVPVEEKLFRSVRVTDAGTTVADTLQLLAKDRIGETINQVWNAQSADKQVEAALKKLFSPDSDMVLVNYLAKHTGGLSARDLRASLARCSVSFRFPVLVDLGSAPKTVTPAADSAGLTALIEKGRIRPPLELRRQYKGHELRGCIEPDGTVSFDGQRFATLSAAGSAARASILSTKKDGGPPSTNGWTFWRYIGPDGKEHEVDEFREGSSTSQPEVSDSKSAAG